MTDTSQGHGWWVASDQKWYPPEYHPSQQIASGSETGSPEQALEQRLGWWLAGDGEWYPPIPAGADAGLAAPADARPAPPAKPAQVDTEESPAPTGEAPPAPVEVAGAPADVLPAPVEAIQPAGGGRSKGLLVVAAIVVIALIAGGIVLATHKSSPPAKQGTPTTVPTTPAVSGGSALVRAAEHTVAASSVSVSIVGGLGSSSSTNGELPLLNERLAYQAPNRVSLSNLISIYGGRATFVRIGSDCWITGLPQADIAASAASCSSPNLPLSPRALLEPLTTASGVTVGDGTLSFSPADAGAFVKSMGIVLNSLGSGAHVAAQVQVTLTGSFISSETLTVTQTGGSAGALTDTFDIHVSGINASSVPRPTFSPTAVGGTLSVNP